MKPEAFLFGLAIATPVIAYVFCRNPLLRNALAVIVTVAFMSACLIVGESRAQSSDFDVVFGIALLCWNALAMAYVFICIVILSAATALFKRLRPKLLPSEKQPESASRP